MESNAEKALEEIAEKEVAAEDTVENDKKKQSFRELGQDTEKAAK